MSPERGSGGKAGMHGGKMLFKPLQLSLKGSGKGSAGALCVRSEWHVSLKALTQEGCAEKAFQGTAEMSWIGLLVLPDIGTIHVPWLAAGSIPPQSLGAPRCPHHLSSHSPAWTSHKLTTSPCKTECLLINSEKFWCPYQP